MSNPIACVESGAPFARFSNTKAPVSRRKTGASEVA